MILFLKIIQLLYPLAILILPMACYRTRFKFPMKFYRSMAYSPAVRRLYRVALAVMVLLFNFSFTRTDGASWWLLPGFIYGLVLLRDNFTSATLHWLHEDRIIQSFWFALIMFSMILPELYTLTVSFALTLLAALFYPSSKLLRMVEHPDRYPEFDGSEREVFDNYD